MRTFTDKVWFVVGSSVSPIVAELYIGEVGSKALPTFKGTTPSYWFRYMDDTWVTIKTLEEEAFSEHLKSVNNIKFIKEETKENWLKALGQCCAAGGGRGPQH